MTNKYDMFAGYSSGAHGDSSALIGALASGNSGHFGSSGYANSYNQGGGGLDISSLAAIGSGSGHSGGSIGGYAQNSGIDSSAIIGSLQSDNGNSYSQSYSNNHPSGGYSSVDSSTILSALNAGTSGSYAGGYSHGASGGVDTSALIGAISGGGNSGYSSSGYSQSAPVSNYSPYNSGYSSGYSQSSSVSNYSPVDTPAIVGAISGANSNGPGYSSSGGDYASGNGNSLSTVLSAVTSSHGAYNAPQYGNSGFVGTHTLGGASYTNAGSESYSGVDSYKPPPSGLIGGDNVATVHPASSDTSSGYGYGRPHASGLPH